MRAVVGHRIRAQEVVVSDSRLPRDGFPVIISVIVENHRAGAPCEDNRVTDFTDDIVFDLVGAIPVIHLDAVIRPSVVGSPVVVIAVPYLALKGELNVHMRRGAAFSPRIIGFHALDPHILGEHDSDDAVRLRAGTVEPHIFDARHLHAEGLLSDALPRGRGRDQIEGRADRERISAFCGHLLILLEDVNIAAAPIFTLPRFPGRNIVGVRVLIY